MGGKKGLFCRLSLYFSLLPGSAACRRPVPQDCVRHQEVRASHGEPPDHVRSGPEEALGADGFGRSDTRQALRAFFEIDRCSVVIAALASLTKEGLIAREVVANAIERYGVNSSAALEHLTQKRGNLTVIASQRARQTEEAVREKNFASGRVRCSDRFLNDGDPRRIAREPPVSGRRCCR